MKLNVSSGSCLAVILTIALSQQFAAADEPKVDADNRRAAIAKSLSLLEHSAKTSLAERQECFTCHNQGLPIMVLTTARRKGFEIDEAELKRQLQFTADFLAKNRDKYQQGRGQAGQTFMAGYAVWALEHGGWAADETTQAVAEYFLKYQSDQDHWSSHTNRPPSEASDFTSNFLGLTVLASYSTAEQRARIAARREQVRTWLTSAEPKDNEDRAFRLWALRVADAPDEVLQSALTDLLKTQRDDGGWAQLDSMESDPYATGTSLVALYRAGQMKADAEPYVRGLKYLRSQQKDDGSWHVVSRSEPFQTYYESGYPHGKDQFISISAGSWATLALLLALPDAPAK